MTDTEDQPDDDERRAQIAERAGLSPGSVHIGKIADNGSSTYMDGAVGHNIPVEHLLKQGLIYLINQAILWPRGLALTAAFYKDDAAPPILRIVAFDQPIIDREPYDPSALARLAALNRADAERYQRFTSSDDES